MIMNILFEWEVMEHYDDQAPEPFGSHLFEEPPVVDQVVMLRWLDGREAYRVRVESIDLERRVVHVRSVLETVWGSV